MNTVSITDKSIQWAVAFVARHGDSDLFPRLPEIEAAQTHCDEFTRLIQKNPLSSLSPEASRRFIVPKGELTYRQATQLGPQDSILLAAILYEYGQGIEDRRLPTDHVFSYRFGPSAEDGLYTRENSWNRFWSTALAKSRQSSVILSCDISDFYNQIYHHTVENQLFESNFPNQAVKWIINLLESTTSGVSRGVPIGPHGTHLIAESSLIPIDNSIKSRGIDFIRYVDDIVVFCDNERQARQSLATIAFILDKQQRLMLQRHKTKLMQPNEFATVCNNMITDRPISSEEDIVLNVIRKYSRGNPYRVISYNNISTADWKKLTDGIIRNIIVGYIQSESIDYARLSWFYRRLSQVGHPGAIDVSLEYLEQLGPCFSTICMYLSSVQEIDSERWKNIGASLLALLDSEEVRQHEFFRISILSLFSRNPHIDHFPQLVSRFQSSDPSMRREILLASACNNAVDWIREQKEQYQGMDPWQRRAFLYCVAGLPADEKRYFLNRQSFQRPFERVLAKWARNH